MADGPNLNSELARFLAEHRQDQPCYPRHDVDYYKRFVDVDNHLNEHIHPHVNQGATSADEKRATWLTDHGPKHIETVIRRASSLVFNPESVLTPYEVYLLLLAAHFHDVGNIFGRDGHEQRIGKIMADLDTSVIGDDTPEQRLIRQIATAHGGYVGGVKEPRNKDTIGELRYLSRSGKPRAALLAAILRFADELAEDKTRTERFLIDNGHIPPESEAFHRYASCLEPIQIDAAEHCVEAHFDLRATDAISRFRKHQDEVYLVDMILENTLKMHREHLYCNSFWSPAIHIAQINVSIDICTDDYHTVRRRIAYSMAMKGYPDSPADLVGICPELAGVTGESVRDELQQAPQAQES